MKLIEQEITLGFYNNIGTFTIPIKQHDTGRRLKIKVIDQDKVYTPDSDTNVGFRMLRPDDKQIYSEECCSIENDYIYITLNEYMISITGCAKCELVFYGNNINITTWSFNLLIEGRVHLDENILHSYESEALTKLLEAAKLQINECIKVTNNASNLNISLNDKEQDSCKIEITDKDGNKHITQNLLNKLTVGKVTNTKDTASAEIVGDYGEQQLNLNIPKVDLEEVILQEEKGVQNGVATLEENGILYNSQLDLDNRELSFDEKSERTNIVSGEKLSTVFGKIQKWFADLKTVAFTGSYNDLSNKPVSFPANGGDADTVDGKHYQEILDASCVTAFTNEDPNSTAFPEHVICYHHNCPQLGYWYIDTIYYGTKHTDANREQIARHYYKNAVYRRYYNPQHTGTQNGWSPWYNTYNAELLNNKTYLDFVPRVSAQLADDPKTTTKSLFLCSNNASRPPGMGYFYHVHTLFYDLATSTSNRTQIAYSYNDVPAKMYIRSYYGGVWSDWNKIIAENNIADNLTTTTAGYVLDARQGKILNDKINNSTNISLSENSRELIGTFKFYLSNQNYVTIQINKIGKIAILVVKAFMTFIPAATTLYNVIERSNSYGSMIEVSELTGSTIKQLKLSSHPDSTNATKWLQYILFPSGKTSKNFFIGGNEIVYENGSKVNKLNIPVSKIENTSGETATHSFGYVQISIISSGYGNIIANNGVEIYFSCPPTTGLFVGESHIIFTDSEGVYGL